MAAAFTFSKSAGNGVKKINAEILANKLDFVTSCNYYHISQA
jgi:hypothetical protein